eukprot:4659801-Ditylum_brightwellii.AAC.1
MVRYDDLENDVTARGYCILGRQMFLYSQNVRLEDTDERLRLVVMALLVLWQSFVSFKNTTAGLFFRPN